ncbi:Heat shock protein HSP 90-alpha like [Actinidia chinensis var. chinensis]|uniref:Heat shock protein HSP 90-alpha like n=1 Tax=Actinidia chinensis var. chinensis TaxID=1590841 RepID=A0A2R6RZ73_ACTCC|nr:Heat shock protein HSP 90-alpha like [Actinidia chinensis var. chinensis]
MAEVKDDEEQLQQHEHTLPAKRKPDLTSVDEIGIENGAENESGDSKKKQKSEFSADDTIFPSVAEEKEIDDDDEEEEDEYITDDDDDEDEDDEDSDEHSNGKAEVVDRKGKGILRDDKGKGKMIEESDETSDGLDDSDGDSSDLSDDPLAEVDLDNILPSRTRGRVHRPGVHISDDLCNNVDDDRDDSDA